MVFCESGYDLARTRTLFLRLCGLCYAMAFLSLYPQIAGLYGPNGLLPVHGLLDPSPALKNDAYDPSKLLEVIKSRPTLLWLSGTIGLSPDLGMDLICILGTLLGLAAAGFPKMANKWNFVMLWTLYQSLYQVGQTFLWFQWDILLLEVGFLCILVAPVRGSKYYLPRPYDHINLMLVRWLLFRMMFASGVVKLTSQCPTWWGLTALPTHYESQCLPTPLAWNAFQFPEIMQKVSVAGTFFVEIGLVFLFYAPTANLRKFTAFHQIALMVVIMVTGNYNFFNFLYIALCMSLFDDSWMSWKYAYFQQSSWLTTKISKLFNLVAYIGIGYCLTQTLIDIQISSSGFAIEPKVKFSKEGFNEFLENATLVGIALGGGSLIFSALLSLYKCMFPLDEVSRRQGFLSRLVSFLNCGFYIWVASGVFLMSLPVFTRGVGQPLPAFVNEQFHMIPSEVTNKASELHIVSSYGLFRRMTGVGGRPEVVIEGSDFTDGPWKEYHFLYKPGNLSEAPKFVLPHQPRLDWQMWFAALGNYQHNPWFISLLYRILENKKEVLNMLMDPLKNPFSQKAPKFIRSKLYKYHFTTINDGTSDWWTREEVGEYSPILTKDDSGLKDYLKKVGILVPLKAAQKSTNMILAQLLSYLRAQTCIVPHHVLVWSISWIVLPILFPILPFVN